MSDYPKKPWKRVLLDAGRQIPISTFTDEEKKEFDKRMCSFVNEVPQGMGRRDKEKGKNTKVRNSVTST